MLIGSSVYINLIGSGSERIGCMNLVLDHGPVYNLSHRLV